MTKEEFKKNIRNLFYSSKTVEKYLEQAYTDIDKIFDKHEAQIKAKDEGYKKLSKAYSYIGAELDDAIKIISAKDKEIEFLKSQINSKPYNSKGK